MIITGNSFAGITGVYFGNVPAVSYTVNSSTQITAVAPSQDAGVGRRHRRRFGRYDDGLRKRPVHV